MFSFFTKKAFLVDSMENMIDIHNHILPGIDDGAKNIEESLSLIRYFKGIGVSRFICTPHIMGDYYPNTPATINSSFLSLQERLNQQPDLNGISLQAGAEHMIDAQFETILDNNEEVPLKDNYLLVETSFLQASINFKEAINKVKTKGYFPVLAHPERYSYVNGSVNYQKIKDSGVYFQLNLLSIAGHYGPEVYNKSLKLLEENLIDFVGTDVHNANHFKSLKKARVPKKVLEQIKKLVDQNNYHFD